MFARRLLHSTASRFLPRQTNRHRLLPARAEKLLSNTESLQNCKPTEKMSPPYPTHWNIGGEKNADVKATVNISPESENPEASWFLDKSFEPFDPSSETTENSHVSASKFLNISTPNKDLEYFCENLVTDLKARNVCVIDMREKCQWTEYMVICEGVSEAHVRRMTQQFYETIKKYSRQNQTSEEFVEDQSAALNSGRIPASRLTIEGRESPDWKLIDMGDIVFHFFTAEARKTYDLEELWSGVGKDTKSLETDVIQ